MAQAACSGGAAFKEVKTAAYLADFLRKLGYDVTENVGGTTALTAAFDSGKPGPTVAVRTDMDCLLFKNEDGSLELFTPAVMMRI